MKLNRQFIIKLPALFEKYELFVILGGVAVMFLLAGFVFFEKAYKTATTVPAVEVDLPKVNSALFEKTVGELEARKKLSPDLPIVDPFQ